MLHTCTRHTPGEACYSIHKCRCDGCRAAHSLKDRKTKGGLASPSDTIPVTKAEIDLAARLIASRDADDLAAMLGLDLTPEIPTGDNNPNGPRHFHHTHGLIRGERVA